jgi:hypothetical protein
LNPRTAILIAVVLGLGGCANMPVLPDEDSEAYDAEPVRPSPVFPSAAVVVDGGLHGLERRYPGGGGESRMHLWNAIRDAFKEKGLAGKVTGADEPADLKIVCEFLLQDDNNPLHSGFSLITLYLFPHWKMVRLTARARCQVRREFLPDFDFEEELLVYKNPILLPFSPFYAGDPGNCLFTSAGQALTVHVLKSLRREYPIIFRKGASPPDG